MQIWIFCEWRYEGAKTATKPRVLRVVENLAQKGDSNKNKEDSNMIENLYHYTNFEVLKLILKNKTFRLSNLGLMDDLDEGETIDFEKLGRHIYISSWTENSIDDIAFWRYSKDEDGVRIRMKKNPFITERKNGTYFLHGIPTTFKNQRLTVGLFEMMKKENILFYPLEVELKKVIYTEDEKLLKPQVYNEVDEDNIFIESGGLGIYKRIEWQGQKEWRYRLKSMPFSTKELDILNNHKNRMNLLVDEIKNRQPIKFIDLRLRKDAFENLEVLTSPYMSDERKRELKKFLKSYIPNAEIRESKLRVRW